MDMPFLRRRREILQRARPDNNYWLKARINCENRNEPRLEVFWRNPELFGIWTLSWPIDASTVEKMIRDGIAVHDPDAKEEESVYVLVGVR